MYIKILQKKGNISVRTYPIEKYTGVKFRTPCLLFSFYITIDLRTSIHCINNESLLVLSFKSQWLCGEQVICSLPNENVKT